MVVLCYVCCRLAHCVCGRVAPLNAAIPMPGSQQTGRNGFANYVLVDGCSVPLRIDT